MAIKFETIEPEKAKRPPREASAAPAPATVPAPPGELALGQEDKPDKPKRRRK